MVQHLAIGRGSGRTGWRLLTGKHREEGSQGSVRLGGELPRVVSSLCIGTGQGAEGTR